LFNDYAPKAGLILEIVLVTGQLSREIEGISEEIGRLFGVLDESAVKLYA
jgi:hypothetical protein